MGTVPGTRADEALLHGIYDAKRTSGEWFALEPGDVANILSGNHRGAGPPPKPPRRSRRGCLVTAAKPGLDPALCKRITWDCGNVWPYGRQCLTQPELAAELMALPDAPWRDVWRADTAIAVPQLEALLRANGIRPERVPRGRSTVKGYRRRPTAARAAG